MSARGPVIPIPPGQKGTSDGGWSAPDYAPGPVPEGWNQGQRMDGITGIDCDCQEAVDWWTQHGPATPYVTESRDGHRVYWYVGEAPWTGHWALPDGARAGEVRSGPGKYCVIPPSIHPDTGGEYYWMGSDLFEGQGPRVPSLPEDKLPPRYRKPRSGEAVTDFLAAEWGERLPNEDCPGSGHASSGAGDLGLQMRDGLVYANCWVGCDFYEVLDKLVESGRYDKGDLWMPAGRDLDAPWVADMAAEARVARPRVPSDEPESLTWGALKAREWEPPRWIVPGVIPDGLTVLAGKRKIGKSWLVGQLACAAAAGQSFLDTPLAVGDTLYLALEDPLRRLASRLPAPPDEASGARLTLRRVAPRLDEGLVDQLEEWRRACERPRLVIVDTLGLVRPPRGGRGNSDGGYSDAYDDIRVLKQWADATGVAVIVIHHARKTRDDDLEDGDPLDLVLGSSGIVSAADTILVLQRGHESEKGSLRGTGRDVTDISLWLQFDQDTCQWSKGLPTYRELMAAYGIKRDEARRLVTQLSKADDPVAALEHFAKTRAQ